MHAGICLPATTQHDTPLLKSFLLAAYTYVCFLGGGQLWRTQKKKGETTDLRHFDNIFKAFIPLSPLKKAQFGAVGL